VEWKVEGLMARVYLASSWRNERQPEAVRVLRAAGHEVYDFRNPEHGLGGFHWSDLDPDWKTWSPARYRAHLLMSPIAAQGYLTDFRAMKWCDVCVLLMPCGRSAHLELGWCAGAGKRTIICLSDGEPELMNLLADDICLDLQEVVDVLRSGVTAPAATAKTP
jgi:hypothetical protein